MTRPPVGVWIIFRDHEGSLRARRFYLGNVVVLTTDEVIEGETVEDVRAQLPAGLINLGRAINDHPCTVEVWA